MDNQTEIIKKEIEDIEINEIDETTNLKPIILDKKITDENLDKQVLNNDEVNLN